MALADQLGAPYQATIGTPALTFDDVMDGEFTFDPEIMEHFNGASVFPRINIGNQNVQIKFKTSDRRAFTSLIKGMYVEDVSLKFKPTITDVDPADGSLTQATGDISFTISDAYVVDAITITNDSSKKAAEFQLTFKACVNQTSGDAPTLTFDFTLGA